MADADLPLSAFESMLRMYDRLLMTASAEGVFIDALAAGHAPTEEICWSLARAFERAGERAARTKCSRTWKREACCKVCRFR